MQGPRSLLIVINKLTLHNVSRLYVARAWTISMHAEASYGHLMQNRIAGASNNKRFTERFKKSCPDCSKKNTATVLPTIGAT